MTTTRGLCLAEGEPEVADPQLDPNGLVDPTSDDLAAADAVEHL